MAAQALMKKGKRSLALFFKSEIGRSTVCQQLNDLMSYLLNPDIPIDDDERIDWCRWLIAGGANFDDFSKIVRSFDNAATCGLVWTANFVAYRCRTCGISPCMSLCADCFHAGNHKGHDFNMFRSQAGGACDCGDVSVMDKGGFCTRHGPDSSQRRPSPPVDLLGVAKVMMPRLFWRLLVHLRKNSKPETLDSYMVTMSDAERFLQFLHTLSDMGAAMREVMTDAMLDADVYTTFTSGPGTASGDADRVQCEANYVAAMESLKCPDFPEEFAEIAELQQRLVHKTLLDELVFWMVKYEFPQKMVTLLLSILPNERYKEWFAVSFVQHYSRVTRTLVASLDRQTISSRVVHISVQLFSNEALARRMVERHHLLDVMLVSLDCMLKSSLTDSVMQDADRNTHMVIDCARDTMRDHCYWPIVSDLINILSHYHIANMLISTSRLLRLWMDVVSYFQGMNLNQRELVHHVEYEPDTYYAAFSAELEICASPMWSLLSHLKSKDHWPLFVKVTQATLAALNNWFDAVNVDSRTTLAPLQVSFHLPLHRYYSMFASQAMRLEMGIDSVLPGEECLKTLMKHPLQIQVAFYEIMNNMWVRNGLQIRGQIMTYIQCHFCNSMLDADVFLLQLCASRLDPDYFVRTALDAFHGWEWLTLSPDTTGYLTEEQRGQLLEGAMQFFATILTFVSHMGLPDKEVTRMELTSLLCIADRTHSQLADLMPEKCGQSQPKDFESTLAEISTYRKPQFEAGGGMQQGMYVPKPSLWEKEFQPIHTHLRAVHRRDYQKAMDRYTEYLRQSQQCSANTVPWPPLRPPAYIPPQLMGLRRILHCKTMHGLLFTILYKMDRGVNVPDSVLQYATFLLHMAISTAPADNTQTSPGIGAMPSTFRDLNYEAWFPSDSALHNCHAPIRNVTILKKAGTLARRTRGDPHRELEELLADNRGSFQALPSSSSSSSLPSSLVVSQVQKYANSAESSFTDPSYTKETIEIDETILTLLTKTYQRLSKSNYVPRNYRTEGGSGSNSGFDGRYYVGRLLDGLCERSGEGRAYLEELYERQKSSPGKDVGKVDQDERRRRAQERQKKLMEEFASRQKAFMEQAMEGDEVPEAAAPTHVEYDCVICGQTTPSTADRPMGLVTLAQATSVLGHRRDTEGIYYLPTSPQSPTYHGTVCSRASADRLHLLKQHFDERSILMSVNLGWRNGVYLQSCGHYLHLDCHKSYISSLSADEEMLRINQVLAVSKGEYLCPFCRQLSNAIVPVHPGNGASSPTISSRSDVNWRLCAENVGRELQKRNCMTDQSNLSVAMNKLMEDLTSAFFIQFYDQAGMPSSAEGMQLFVSSVARTSLELELIHMGGVLCQESEVQQRRKDAFLPLLDVLRLHTSVLNIQPLSATWTRVTGLKMPDAEASSSLQPYQREVAVLLRDPVAILFQLLLSLPADIDKDSFTCIVRTLYNLMYVQALAVMSCRFTDLEREAWRQKNTQICCESLVGLLSLVINELSGSSLYRDSDMEHDTLAICQSVWSPQSVELSIQEHCLHLLRVAALLQSYLYKTPILTHSNPQAEYQILCGYLGLCEQHGHVVDPAQFQSCHGLNWLGGQVPGLVQEWTRELASCIGDNGGAAKSLLLVQTSWQKPRLFALPNEYDQIFQHYRKKVCRTCSSVPRDGAVCLVCSQFLCFKDPCCREQGRFECVHHSLSCGSGTGIYLIVNSSVIVIVRGARVTLWGSVYLDEYGEEDRDLKRGRPLYLSRERYQLLERQWLDHSFDQACKKWIWHNDKL